MRWPVILTPREAVASGSWVGDQSGLTQAGLKKKKKNKVYSPLPRRWKCVLSVVIIDILNNNSIINLKKTLILGSLYR